MTETTHQKTEAIDRDAIAAEREATIANLGNKAGLELIMTPDGLATRADVEAILSGDQQRTKVGRY